MATDHPHTHERYPTPSEPGDRFGVDHPTDGDLIGDLLGAMVDACIPCQRIHARNLSANPVSTTRVIELACISVAAAMGGLPGSLTDVDGETPGPLLAFASLPFRRAAAAGLDEQHRRMFEVVESFSHAEREQALDDAVDLLAGHLVLSGGETDR